MKEVNNVLSHELQQVQQLDKTGQALINNTNIHKNTINGIEYKLMNQADAEWKDVKYTTRSGTIGKVGCMITSVAVVLNDTHEVHICVPSQELINQYK